MAKSMKCSDVVADCDWGATAETEEELMRKIEEHARKEHGFEVMPEELIEKVKANIKDQ